MLRRQAAIAARPALAPPATTSAAISWTEIGPGNVGGRLSAIWIDPSNAQHLLVGAGSGGLWQSNDGGTTWTAVSEFPGALTIGSIAQLPNGTLLVGTGDAFSAGGDGMLSSTDGGSTWTPIASTAPQGISDFWTYINSIAVSSGGIVLAGTDGGITRSTDGGQSWTPVSPSGTGGISGTMDIAFDPNDPNDVVADDEAGGVEHSNDAGQTWTAGSGLPNTGNRVSIAFDPSVRHSVYALVNNNGDSSPSGEVYQSSDGGATWSLLAGTGAFINSDTGSAVGALCDAVGAQCQGDYDNVILVEPHASGAPATIVAGGIDIFTSTDGGKTWTETGSWLDGDPNYLHADQHVFAYSSAANALYVGNDGGFYKQLTSNTWREENEGLAVTQFYSATGHEAATSSLNVVNGTPVTPIVAGAQDNGTLLYEGYANGAAPQPDDWTQIFSGDGGVTQVDPADGNDVYGEYVYLALSFSSSGGPGMQPYNSEPQVGSRGANFIAPYVLVPNGTAAATQMLAGGAYLWLGNGIQGTGATWTQISSTAMYYGVGGFVSAIAVDPRNPNDVWVGYDGGEIWHSTDVLGTSPTWIQSGGGVLPSRPVEGLWIVPGQPGAIYATFGDYPDASGSNIWVTTDGGGTWADIGSGLPAAPVYSLVTHPGYPQLLYAGTLTGVYSSADGGQSWSPSSLGPANVPVRQLTWFDTSKPDSPTLLAATYGRGAWLGSPAYNPTPTLASISPAELTAGAPDTLITLTGSGFVQGVTSVTLDGKPVAVTYESANELRATAPAGDLAVGGTHTFLVDNPIPGGGTSAGANLTVANPVPVLDSISPTSVQTGSSAITLTVTGSAFVPASTVAWNGSPLTTTYVSATSLTATIPASDLVGATASAQITVVTGSPGGGTSEAVAFSVDNPVPVLSSISPSSATAGTTGLTLTVTGSNFMPSSVVNWNGSALTTTHVSVSSLTASVPASDLSTGTDVQVTVVTGSPGGGTSNVITLTVNNPAPVLGSISPSSATAGAAALTLTVTGSSFVPSSTVTWNGNTLSTTYVSATSLTAIVPSSDMSTAADAQVTVMTPHPGGGTSSAATFTVQAAPASASGGTDGGGKGGGGALDDLALALLLSANLRAWWRRFAPATLRLPRRVGRAGLG